MSTEVKVAAITAIGAILVAIIYAYFGRDEPTPVPPDPSPKPEEPALVTIHSEMVDSVVNQSTYLGELPSGQEVRQLTDQYILYSEELDVEIDGENKGSLVMERGLETTDEINEIPLKPDRHYYDIEGTLQLQSIQDNSLLPRFRVTGEDHIVVSEEDYQTFNAVITYNGEDDKLEIKLKPAS